MKNISKDEKCNHKWIISPTFKECAKCGEIVRSQKLCQINGIISDDDSLEDTVHIIV